ncbi:MAG: leucine-rich repeat domain-containing protein [Polyangiaceae bacterium]|nr:leucine-rich repeat domain-containing protein [Polyangiaceae bacterium]
MREQKAVPSEAPVASAKPAAEPVVPAPTPTPTAPPAQEAKPKKVASDCPKTDPVSFPSADFEAAVRLKLQKPTGDISRADLKRLHSLNLVNVSLSELDVCLFPHMTGLKELFLGKGDYSDLSPISGATGLESLRASLNKVSDLRPLSKLTKLDRLDLGHTEVTDLSPIASLTNLTELMLDDTQVADLAPLSGMKLLERLSIQRTKVAKVPDLKDLKKLKFVYVTGTPADEDPTSWAPFRRVGAKIVNQ